MRYARAKRIARTLAVVLAAGVPVRADGQESTLIRDALLVDGRGTPSRRAGVRIVGDRIVEIGTLAPRPTDRVIEAHGLALAPGFIDTHSHHDRGLFANRDAM